MEKWSYTSMHTQHRRQMEAISQFHALAAWPPSKDPQYPQDSKLSGVDSQSGLCAQECLWLFNDAVGIYMGWLLIVEQLVE
jgi:hypothetical protein